jgi:hypothetical protein
MKSDKTVANDRNPQDSILRTCVIFAAGVNKAKCISSLVRSQEKGHPEG